MKMNEIIREKRKNLNLTQEQVAEYLGVTAPAVHKWEKGTSLPDVAILPALARLLKIDLNTLFAFERELTEQEVNIFCNKVVLKIQAEGYDAGFESAMEKVQEYPNCEKLIFCLASMLDGGRVMFCVQNPEKYEKDIEKLYERAAQSEDEKVRNSANQLLIYKALNKKEFDKAERLWEALPEVTIDKKIIKATICMNQENHEEAIKILEEKLYASATELQNCLVNLMVCFERAERLEEMEVSGETLKGIVDTLALWKYGKYMADYQIAVVKKDRERTLKSLRLMLASMNEAYDLHEFPLYRELPKSSEGTSYRKIMANALAENLKIENGLDGEGFLQDDEELQKILNEFTC